VQRRSAVLGRPSQGVFVLGEDLVQSLAPAQRSGGEPIDSRTAADEMVDQLCVGRCNAVLPEAA
jgi:hypothetical protein